MTAKQLISHLNRIVARKGDAKHTRRSAMATAQQRTEVVTLPTTEAAIKAEFPGRSNAGLRKEILAACLSSGGCIGLSRSVALTACGLASLTGVDAVARKEFAEKGYDRVFVGDRDANDSTQVAYLDQPLQY